MFEQLKEELPMSEKFTSKDAALAYLQQDPLPCLLCGQLCQSLGMHLQRSHKSTSREYKITFNIPLSLSLTAHSTRVKNVEAGKVKVQEGKLLSTKDPATYQKVRSKVDRTKKRTYPFMGPNKWKEEHFDQLFRIMKDQQVTISKALVLLEGPDYSTFHKHITKNPALKQKFLDVVHSLPIHLQAKMHATSEDNKQMVLKIKETGLSNVKIAALLGVNAATIDRIIKSAKETP
jgi:IS30 family transposase